MEPRRNTAIASSISVQDMRKSLGFYARTSRFQSTDKPQSNDGNVARAVGFDSPLLILSPRWYVLTEQTRGDATKIKPGGGVEFCFGRSGTGTLDAFFNELKAKGITIITQSRMEI
jgi:hypothetical protein